MKIGVFATFMSPIAGPQMIRDFGRRFHRPGYSRGNLGPRTASRLGPAQAEAVPFAPEHIPPSIMPIRRRSGPSRRSAVHRAPPPMRDSPFSNSSGS